MNYCAVEDAYQEIGGAPTPGCGSDYAAKMARKEERRKARRCKGPAAAYLDINDANPEKKRPEEPFKESFKEPFKHVTLHDSDESHLNPYAASDPKYDKDIMYNYAVNEASSHVMTIPTSTDAFTKKKFFGASEEDDFADYIPDQKDYRLQPDFLTAFEQAGVARAGSAEKLSNPSVNMFWKPIKNGAQTSFVEHLPPPGGKFHRDTMHSMQSTQTDEIMKRIDKIFARLDDMNTPSPEHITSELLMFISSGIFVLFMMDLLVKKGSMLRF